MTAIQPCPNTQPHEAHEWIGEALRSDCPGVPALLDPFEEGISATEMARRHRLSNGEWVHVDELGREVSVRHSRFHGAMISTHEVSGTVYIGEAAVEMARKLLEGTPYRIVGPAAKQDGAPF